MTVTLINTTRRMKTYNLPHDTYCEVLGRCACITLPGRDKRTVCSSLTLASGAEVKGLPEAVLQVTQIAKDISTGILQAKKIPSASGDQSIPDQEDTKRLRKKIKQQKPEHQEQSIGGEI